MSDLKIPKLPVIWDSLECFPGFSRANGNKMAIAAHSQNLPAIILRVDFIPKDRLLNVDELKCIAFSEKGEQNA